MKSGSDSSYSEDQVLANDDVECHQPCVRHPKMVLTHSTENGDDESDQWTTTIDDSDQSIASSSDDDDYDDDDEDEGESDSGSHVDEGRDQAKDTRRKSDGHKDEGDATSNESSSGQSTSTSSDGHHSRESPSEEESHSYSHTSTTSRNDSKSGHSRKQNDRDSSPSNYSTTTESAAKEYDEKLPLPNSPHFSKKFVDNENSSRDEEFFESVQDMTYYSQYTGNPVKGIRCVKRDHKFTNHNFGFPSHVNRFDILEQDCSGDETPSSDAEEEYRQQHEEPYFEDHDDDERRDQLNEEQTAVSSHTQSSLHDSDTLFDFGLLSDHDINVDSSANYKPDQLAEKNEPFVFEFKVWDDKKNISRRWSYTV